jgi:hypothetical protein
MNVKSIEELRALYAAPRDRAIRKQLARLDKHCRRFISLSPYLVLASANPNGDMDASPRGGDPGFVKVPDEVTLLVPDAPGNNRLDSLENIIATGRVGLLFMIPGVDETLRVNGAAVLSCAETDIGLCTDERRRPKLVIRITVREAYLHCAKALMRSRLWDPQTQIERSLLPTIGQMINDQTGVEGPVETQEEMRRRYAVDL